MNREIRREAVNGSRATLREEIFNYVMADLHRLEVFTDLEICNEDDYEDCKSELFILLNDMDTDAMREIVERITNDTYYKTYEEIFFGVSFNNDEEEEVFDDDDIERLLIKSSDLDLVIDILDKVGIDWELA